MSDTTVVYLDTLTDERRSLLAATAPPEIDLVLYDDLDDERAEAVLLESEYVVVASRRVDASLFERSPRLRFVQKAGVGVDNIDVREARARGVLVANTPGANANSVAELTILTTLALYRKLLTADSQTRAGRWPMWTLRSSSFELRGKVHGVVGLGMVGRRVAELSRGFGTDVVYHDVVRCTPETERALGVRYAELDDLLGESDIVSLHVPLTESTRHLVGARELASMKPTAVLVNVARGGVVAESPLAQALRDGRLAGAAVDVWETEPVDVTNPLLAAPNLVATSHLGGASSEAAVEVLRMAFANILRMTTVGRPDHVVDDC